MNKSYLDELMEAIEADRKKHPIRWFFSDMRGWMCVAINAVRKKFRNWRIRLN